MPYHPFVMIALLFILSGCAAVSPKTDTQIKEPAIISPLPIFYDEVEDDAFGELFYQLLVGEIAGHLGQLDISVTHYLEAARLSQDARIAERATRIALITDTHAMAIEAATRWIELAPSNLDARQVLAMLLINTDRVPDAITHLNFIMQRVERIADNGFGFLAALLGNASNAQAAVDAMEIMVSMYDAKGIDAYLALANLAARHNAYEQSLQATQKALQIDPDSMPARILRARALNKTGNTQEAIRELHYLVRKQPRDIELNMTYARMLLSERRFDEAQESFSRLVEMRPNDADLIYTLALLNIESERYTVAERYLHQLIDMRRREMDARYYLGRIAEVTGRDAQAIVWYERVEDGEHWLDAHIRAANLYAQTQRLNIARQRFERLRFEILHTDETIRLYALEAQMLRDLREYEAGMELLNHALSEYPDDIQLLYARALMAERVDRIDILEADLRNILAQDANNVAALNALGYTLADRTDRYEEAYHYVLRAYELVSDDAAIVDSMGWALFRLGKLEAAETYLRRAHAMLDDPEIASNLAALLWHLGEYEEAWQILFDALEAYPDFERLLRLQQQFEND